MNLVDASEQDIEFVLAGTAALWSDGLDQAAYAGFIHTLRRSAWARTGAYRFVALRDDDGRVLSAMKLYRLKARAGGREVTLGGVGAVFTPPALRGRGHAARLIEEVHREMAARGDEASLLYSEIGAGYYERLGYRALDPCAARLGVPSGGEAAAPTASLRRVEPGEAPEGIVALRAAEDAGVSFALARDPAYWEQLRLRVEIPERHLGTARWESRLMVDERGGATRGFLWSLLREPSSATSHDGGAAARVLEFGESAPRECLPGLLDDLFAACRRRGIDSVEVWQAGELARRDPRLRPGGACAPRRLDPAPVVPMWCPLGSDASALAAALQGAPLLMSDVF